MAPLPSKRRKLEHTPSDKSMNEDQSENHIDQQSSAESADEAAISQLKQAPLRQKHTQAIDDAALYAGRSYKSSLFKLQVDELLAEVQPNYEKRLSRVNEALRKLKTSLEGIEDREPGSVSILSTFWSYGSLANVLCAGVRSYEVIAQISQNHCSLSRPEARQKCCL